MLRTLPFYQTENGQAFNGDALKLLTEIPDDSIDLVMTSPPFALRRQKTYGNVEETEYVNWIKPFGKEIHRILKNTGSFVLDLGGAYRSGIPSRSLYNFRVLIAFCDELGFHLAEDFYWFNPAKLPSPIEWVNKKKIRAKDSVNTIWWFSKTEWPKADVTKVLTPYSTRMKKLIENPESFYTPKKRPSGHDISAGFGKDNGGSIPSNMLSMFNSEAYNMLSMPNTDSNSNYLRLCKEFGLERHPARFPIGIPNFFIKMLTSPGDLVLDVFAGSNTTGFAAEVLNRKWIAFENNRDYLITSIFRFLEDNDIEQTKKIINNMSKDNGHCFYIKNEKLPLPFAIS